MNSKQGGFGLIEVVIATAMLSILALGLMKFSENAQKAQKVVQNSLDFDILKSSIKRIIDKPALCGIAFYDTKGRATFNPAASTQASISMIKMGGAVVASLEQQLGGGLVISKFDFKQVKETTPELDIKTGFVSHMVELHIEATRNVGVKTLTNRGNPFRFNILTNDEHQIVSCGTSDDVALPTLAWVKFKGECHPDCEIVANKNISRVTRLEEGLYKVSFTALLPDAEYKAIGTAKIETSVAGHMIQGHHEVDATTTKSDFQFRVISVDMEAIKNGGLTAEGAFTLADAKSSNIVVTASE